MTYDDYNKIIEEIIASPSDDKIMLEGFEKLRNAYKELDEKVKSALHSLNLTIVCFKKVIDKSFKSSFDNFAKSVSVINPYIRLKTSSIGVILSTS